MLVMLDFEVVELVVFNSVAELANGDGGEGEGVARQLGANAVEVVFVEVAVAFEIDELVGFQTAVFCEEVGEERVGGDVETGAEGFVVGALVHRAREFVSVVDIELAENVARGERHFGQLARVPRAHYETATGALSGVF